MFTSRGMGTGAVSGLELTFLEVVLRARRDRVEGEGLGDAATEGHAHAVHELLRAVQLLVDRGVLREAKSGAGARQYRHLKIINGLSRHSNIDMSLTKTGGLSDLRLCVFGALKNEIYNVMYALRDMMTYFWKYSVVDNRVGH